MPHVNLEPISEVSTHLEGTEYSLYTDQREREQAHPYGLGGTLDGGCTAP